MKHLLVITFTSLKTDARVRRHVNLLKEKYQLTVACFDAERSPQYIALPLKQKELTLIDKVTTGLLLAMRWFSQAYKHLHPFEHLVSDVSQSKFDLILANDIESLPLAFKISKQQKCPVVFDAHEYAPRHFEDKFVWRLLFQPLNIYLCKKYIHQTAGMITIGSGLAKEYEKNFQVKPVVITNANHFHKLNPSPLKNSAIRMVHHGIATPSRKLELMIEMMDYLDDRFTLDMYLLPLGFSSSKTKNYPETLKELAARNSRVRILPPIKGDEIVSKINEYDIGVFLIPPVNFNYQNTLPNKLFDFIQARLAIAIGPTPEMAEIVNNYEMGVVSEDFTPKSLAEKLIAITPEQLQAYKQNSIAAAEKLNAEENQKILIDLIEKVLQQKQP
ncbi:MAG TPA: hypothetical protein VFU05_14625 [Cyclobacteriaceae bacterium]|nr:hypothetical protein [Cyclobacteriaceae bacterium]